MGRYRIHLDPDGYQRTAEPGFHYWISGADLLPLLTTRIEADGSTRQLTSQFFVPPGSEWLCVRPKQMDPEHFRDANLEYYVVDTWTVDGGATATTFEPTRKPTGATNADNVWLLLSSGSSISAPPYSGVTWSDVFSQAGLTMPSGFSDIAYATTSSVESDSQNLQSEDFHPFIQWRQYPGPDSSFAFQFGNLIFLLAGGLVTVLMGDASLSPPFRKLDQFKAADAISGGPTGSVIGLAPRDYSMLVMPVGYDDVYVFLGGGQHRRLNLRKSLDVVPEERLLSPGWPGWIVAMPPSSKLAFQVQVVGYPTVTAFESSGRLFDLGSQYKPSENPVVRLATRFDTTDESDITTTVSGTQTTLSMDWTAPGGGQDIIYSIDPDGSSANTWDGTHTYAELTLGLTSGSPGGIYPFLAPQIRRLELRFPVVLEDRPNNPVTLDDSQFESWQVETNYPSPLLRSSALAKRLRVTVWDKAAALLIANGFDKRDGFPIHVEELTSTGPDVWTVRAAGWVSTLELTELKSEDPDAEEGVRKYTFEADALLSRLDTNWPYLPQLVDPSHPGGVMEHTFAIEETLHQSGFDPADTSQYIGLADPGVGTDMSQLPGTWGTTSGQLPKRVDSEWAPNWDATKLEYAEKIAQDWRGWVLREELDGLIRYHQDFMVEALENGKHYISAVLYWSGAAATAGGVSGQYIMSDPVRHRVPPRANAIRVMQDEPGDSLFPHYLDRWSPSLDDISPLDPDFLGELRVHQEVVPATWSKTAMRHLCRTRLLQLCRRSSPWSVEVPKAPWRFSPNAIRVGDVITVDGDGYGPHLIVHMEVECLKSAASPANELVITRLTLDRLPTQSSAGSLAGDYPGQGKD